MIKLIVSDIDGRLYVEDKPAVEAIDLLKNLQKNGVHSTFATSLVITSPTEVPL